MRIPRDEIERLKREVSVEQFLDHPKRQGAFLVARCPLPGHDDRTPSFRLHRDEGWWKCMGCGRGGGDVLSFAGAYWGLSWPRDFPVVLERLGARPADPAAPSTLPPGIRETAQRAEHWPRLPDAAGRVIFGVATELWAYNLWRPVNRDALAYLQRRGLPAALIRAEWIGVSTGTLRDMLEQRGLSLEIAQLLGLLRRDGQETFNGRLTFPEWRLVEGCWSPVWATARLYADGAVWDEARKYLNVRGDRPVVGLHRARAATEVVVVEGVFDRLAVQSFGDAAVCLGSNQPGAAMLSELRWLARGRRLILLGDRDRAGRQGLLRTLAGLDLPPTAEVYIATLPRGIKDPGNLAERPDGAALYQEVRASARRIDLARFTALSAACHSSYERQKAAGRARTSTLFPATRLWASRKEV